MKAPKIQLITFAAALGLALVIPAAWAHPPKRTTSDQNPLSTHNSPTTGIYEVPGGCCWGGAIEKYNEPIKFTFDRPVRIPGMVLPAGSYWFVMQDTATGNTVSILDSDQYVIKTLAVLSAENPNYYPNDPLVTLAEGGPGQPDALVSWFLPGMSLGHEFAYPKAERRVMDEEPQETIHVRWGGNYAKVG